MSALVTDLAEEARRRKAAGDYLRRHKIPKLSEQGVRALQAEIDAEVAAATKTKTKTKTTKAKRRTRQKPKAA